MTLEQGEGEREGISLRERKKGRREKMKFFLQRPLNARNLLLLPPLQEEGHYHVAVVGVAYMELLLLLPEIDERNLSILRRLRPLLHLVIGIIVVVVVIEQQGEEAAREWKGERRTRSETLPLVLPPAPLEEKKKRSLRLLIILRHQMGASEEEIALT